MSNTTKGWPRAVFASFVVAFSASWMPAAAQDPASLHDVLGNGVLLYERTVDAGGIARTFHEYTPVRYTNSRPTITVIAPDGVSFADGSLTRFIRNSGWAALAAQREFVVRFATPQAAAWNLGAPTADAQYLERVLLAADYPTGATWYTQVSNRKYVIGYGAGGLMAQAAALESMSSSGPTNAGTHIPAGIAVVDAPSAPWGFVHYLLMEGKENATVTRGILHEAPKKSLPVAVLMRGRQHGASDEALLDFWKRSNATDAVQRGPEACHDRDDDDHRGARRDERRRDCDDARTVIYRNTTKNPNQKVVVRQDASIHYDAALATEIYDDFFYKVRRYINSPFGTLGRGYTPREMRLKEYDVSDLVPVTGPGPLKQAWIAVPPGYDGSRAYPLVLALHGVSQTGDLLADQTKWFKVARDNDVIVLLPTGASSNQTSQPRWSSTTTAGDDLDTPFVLGLLQKVKTTHRIDPGRVYITGFSQGGGKATTLGMKYPTLFAAAGFFAQTAAGVDFLPYADLSLEMPVWMFRGDLDGADSPLIAPQRMHWQGVNHTTAVAQLQTVPGIEVNANLNTEIFDGPRSEFRYTRVVDQGHNTLEQETYMLWEDFMSRFTRNPDGTITDGANACTPRSARHWNSRRADWPTFRNNFPLLNTSGPDVGPQYRETDWRCDETLDRASRSEDPYFVLAEQYIAAYLNKRSWCQMPAAVAGAFDAAAQYFYGHRHGHLDDRRLNDRERAQRSEVLGWAAMLKAWNGGARP